MAATGSAGGEIELAELIQQVRDDLELAQQQGGGSPGGLRFAVERVSLEVAVQVRREGSGRGSLRIGVVSADVGGGASRDATHRIQVELLPRQSGGTYEVGGELEG